MLAPSLYSFKSLVSRVVSRYRVMGGTKEHVYVSTLFLRESDRQRLGDFCPAAECAARLANRAGYCFWPPPSCLTPQQVMTAKVIIA